MVIIEKKSAFVLGMSTITIVMVLFIATHNEMSHSFSTMSENTLVHQVFGPSTVKQVEVSALSSFVNFIHFKQLAEETLRTAKEPIPCPVVAFPGIQFPMCLLPLHTDTIVSQAAMKGETYWEKEHILPIIRLLHRLRTLSERHERDVLFVDMGTNIGTYSVPIIHSGFKVVSVEAQWEAIRRYTLSLYMGNVTDYQRVTILHNAVTGETGSLLNLALNPTNAGGSPVMEGCYTAECNKTLVRSITLDNLVPVVVNSSANLVIRRPQVVMKVDIEGSEPRVFTERTAAKFFLEADVIAVQLEWLYNPAIVDDVQRRQALVLFFTSRGYSIRNAASLGSYLTPSQCLDGTFQGDLMFTKRGLDDLIL